MQVVSPRHMTFPLWNNTMRKMHDCKGIPEGQNLVKPGKFSKSEICYYQLLSPVSKKR